MSGPAISVVIPTYQRAASLRRTLAAVRAQDLEVPFEVIVVDNGTTDGTADVVAEVAATDPRVRALRLDTNAGPGPARNAGWRAATAPVVVFTDDDLEPVAGWLRALHAATRGRSGAVDGADIAMGRTTADPDALAAGGPFSHFVRVEGPMPWFPTCNIAYRRDLLERLGGFDESFTARLGSSFGDDTDLGWRALESGAVARFVPEATVVHEVTSSDWRAWVGARQRRGGVPAVLAAHPGLRAQLPRPWLYERSHPRALVAGAGLLALVARPTRWWAWLAAAACARPYWSFRTRGLGNRPVPGMGRPSAVAGHLVADLVEVAVVVRAARRHRVVVL